MPAFPTGIVKYGDALYVSAHLPHGAEPKRPAEVDWHHPPRGVFEVTASGTRHLCSMTYPRILAVDADYIWTQDSWMRRSPRGGGPYRRLGFSDRAWGRMYGDEMLVAWSSLIVSCDRRAPLDGETPEDDGVVTLVEDAWATSFALHDDLIVYDARKYTGDLDWGGHLHVIRRGTKTPRVLAELPQRMIQVEVVGDDIVMAFSKGPLRSIPLAHRAPSLRTIVVADDTAYYGARDADENGHYAIVALPLDAS